jgi:hypothetical protein
VKRHALVLLAVLAALACAGCGALGGDDEAADEQAQVQPSPPAQQEQQGAAALLVGASQKIAEAGSARMALNVSMTIPGAPSELGFAAEGVFDFVNQRGMLALDLDGIAAALGAQGAGIDAFLPDRLVMDGTVMYVRMPGLKEQVPGAKPWVRMDVQELAAQQGQDLSQLQQLGGQADPTQLLKVLEAVGGSIETVGEETIRDEVTTHYRASLDLAKLGSVLPEAQRAAFQQQLDVAQQQLGLTEVPFDVWLGQDGLLRRIAMSLDLSAAAAQSGTPGPASVGFTMDVYDYGVEVDVEVPPKGKTMDFEKLLGAGLGNMQLG